MNIYRSCRLAVGTASVLMASGLLAGEIVLFDSEGLQGNRLAFRDTVSSLDGTGFNDRTASISVRAGTWEVCFDANFQGACMQMPPGDYPRLDPPFNRSISSLREVGGGGSGANYVGPAPLQNTAAAEITLFDGENFQGNRVTFGEIVPNLDGTDFNDRTASISVRGGTWQVCFDAEFQGACTQLAPGDYPRLDPPFNRSISSVRPADGVEYGGNYMAAPLPLPQLNPGVGATDASIGINLPLYPELVPVPGYPVYYAPQVNSNYFFYDGMYWVYQQDNWYASSWYNGPWGLVAPDVVPLFVLRVPVRYFRQPPAYFRGWSSNAPPRWGEHWGNAWAQNHRGWDSWNHNVVPAPAPLPSYQRQYSGNRYPAATQQRVLQTENYRYQPQDAVVRQHYQAQGAQSVPAPSPPAAQRVNGRTTLPQEGTSPAPGGRSSQTGGAMVQSPAVVLPPPPQASPATQRPAQQLPQAAAQREQQSTSSQGQAQKPATNQTPPQQPSPAAQRATQQAPQAAAQREQQPTRSQGQPQKPAANQAPPQQPNPAAQRATQQAPQAGAQREQQPTRSQGQAQTPAANQAPPQQSNPAAQRGTQQAPQAGAQREQPATRSQGQDKGAQGKGAPQEPKEGQDKGGERNK